VRSRKKKKPDEEMNLLQYVMVENAKDKVERERN